MTTGTFYGILYNITCYKRETLYSRKDKKGRFMEQQNTNNEKVINLADLLYVVKKNWIVELAIVLVVILCGGIYAKFFRKPFYVATEDIIIKADDNSTSTTYSTAYTSLAKNYIDTVSKLFKTDSIITSANASYLESNKDAEKNSISAKKITVSSDDTLIMTISYKDYLEEDARAKLDVLVKTVEKFSNETVEVKTVDENGKEVVKTEKKYFNANVSIIPMNEMKCTRGSDTQKIILISVAISIVLAFLYALFMYMVIDKVNSEERLETITGKKNLVSVNKKKAEEQTALEVDAVSLDLKKLSDTLIYIGDDKYRVYQIQSTVSGEGKTSLTVNLAKALGESNRKTLIIDCDFYKPSIHKAFRLHRETGITDYFKGEKNFDEIVKHTSVENVDIITCGGRISNHTIFFTSPKFKEIIEKAKGAYDFVLIDSAPIKAASDYINVTPLTDATILVVKADAISARDVSTSVTDLTNCGAEIVGTVFNFSEREAKRHYYYYYGYGKENEKK